MADVAQFFVCNEHPEFPLGKPFGPYPSLNVAAAAMARHQRYTGHSDMVIFTGPAAHEGPSPDFAADLLLSAVRDVPPFHPTNTQRCFAVGDCVKNSNGSHFRKTVDVNCGDPVSVRKR